MMPEPFTGCDKSGAPLRHLDVERTRRCALAAKIVYFALRLRAVEDSNAACRTLFRLWVDQPLEELIAYHRALEAEFMDKKANTLETSTIVESILRNRAAGA